jgi:beta-lactamase class D
MDESWPSSFKGSFEDTKPSFFLLVGWAKMDENVLVFATHNVVHHEKNMSWQMKLQNLLV